MKSLPLNDHQMVWEAVVVDVTVKEKIKLLVQEAVEAYLNENKQRAEKRRIGILLGYETGNLTGVLEAVTILSERYEVTLLLSRKYLADPDAFSGYSILPLEGLEREDVNGLLNELGAIVLPVASYQLLAKLALTIDDDPISSLVLQFQMLGKPVIVVKDEVEFNVYQQISAPYAVQNRVDGYIRQIQADQVKWVPLSSLVRSVKEQLQAFDEKQPLILAKHIEKASQEGLEALHLSKKSKLTPVAKDLAREFKIQLKKQDS
ncbi:hypothetical protein LC085_16540 [Bacillus tianshenii]|uniref:hypothetical protein n=1 Tax=Sutcliffiella tianshenii TaxID=1463404 RepID=UPI001CD74D9B|nr:hypothetical protein [Bacillus tianshenii]MCA1321516.1 hypothetical protein [Bacillus tianshenii]